MVMKTFYVYMLASKRNGTLYIGITNNLQRRHYEHETKAVQSFTAKYSVHKLVYYEQTEDVESAMRHEKQLKRWNRT